MINSLAINNLRTLSDTYIDLKPITVLVGKNSSGKSSFIRTFPLLRQSIESNTIGPILWYGKYVDFGAFNEAVNRYCEKQTIDFKFKLSLDERNINRKKRYQRNKTYNHIFDTEVIINVREKSVGKTKTGKTILNNLNIKLDEELLTIEFSDEGKLTKLNVNQYPLIFSEKNDFKIYDENRFLPEIYSKRKIRTYIDNEMKTVERWDAKSVDQTLLFSLAMEMKPYFYHSTDIYTIVTGLGRLYLTKKDTLKNALRSTFKNLSFFQTKLDEKTDEIINKLYSYLIMINVNNILNVLNDDLVKTFQGVMYIAPLRSTAERYYRFQDLQVNEIDHEGSNLAMLLNSLTAIEKRRFEDWTFDNLGFKLKVKEVGLHYSLKIEIDEEEYNISDMGFGFSQISPIIAMLWFETIKKDTKKGISKDLIFAIEQPELHLHPKFQSKLTKLFVNIINYAKEHKRNIKIIFETHSNTMIDTLGEAIEEKMISSNDISIVTFEKSSPKEKTLINKAYYDDDGYLCNWPIGFFSGNDYAY